MRHEIAVGPTTFEVVVPDEFEHALRRVELGFDIAGERELLDAMDRLGGPGAFHLNPTGRVQAVYGSMGSRAPRSMVDLWLPESMSPSEPQIPAIMRLLAAREKAAREKAAIRATGLSKVTDA